MKWWMNMFLSLCKYFHLDLPDSFLLPGLVHAHTHHHHHEDDDDNHPDGRNDPSSKCDQATDVRPIIRVLGEGTCLQGNRYSPSPGFRRRCPGFRRRWLCHCKSTHIIIFFYYYSSILYMNNIQQNAPIRGVLPESKGSGCQHRQDTFH